MNTIEYKIEANIPIPPIAKKHGDLCKTIRALGVGDSFAVEFSRSIQTNASIVAKRAGIKVATRTAIEGGKKTMRIWRIE